MMKKFLLAGLLCLVLGAGSAAALDLTSYPGVFRPGNVVFNLGVGLGSSDYGSTSIPPVQASLDFATPIAGLPFSLGGFFGFTQSEYSTYKYTVMAFGGRINYHFNFDVPNLDVYLGLSLGWYTGKWDNSSFTAYSDKTKVYWDSQLGVRYFFTGNLAAFLELGAGIAYGKIGVAWKL
jgi:hypothetical protein